MCIGKIDKVTFGEGKIDKVTFCEAKKLNF